MPHDRILYILAFLLFTRIVIKAGFSNGRIMEGQFEYSKWNGWMTIQNAVKICEEDLACGGFTYHGTITEDLDFEIYFFHYVSSIFFDPGNSHTWSWITYTVNRDFILLPGYHFADSTEMRVIKEPGNLKLEPEQALKYCQNMGFCTAITQDDQSGLTYALENFYFFNRHPTLKNWTTLVSLKAKSNQVFDFDNLNINKCCPNTKTYRDIDLSGVNVPMQVERVSCNISKEEFLQKYVKRRKPVMLQGCLSDSLFNDPSTELSKFGGMDFDQILERLFNRGNETSTAVSRPKLRRRMVERMRQSNFRIDYMKAQQLVNNSNESEENLDTSPTFTHYQTPNDAHFTYKDLLEMRESGTVRVFLKLSFLKSQLECYQEYRIKGSNKLKKGHEKCLVLDGLWKPPPLPDDLYALTYKNHDLAWIIMSAEHTGSQMHHDPDLMGAWNMLLTGRKWWAVIPYRASLDDFQCDLSCSPQMKDASHVYPWFKHVLPQIRNRRYYGKTVVEFVQLPGEALYLPYGMPHTIFNIDDNAALTENYLFPDALPALAQAIGADVIQKLVPKWNVSMSLRNMYNKYTDKEDRKRIREMYDQVVKLSKRYPHACH